MPAFGSRHYVPILKGKKGEFDALEALPAPTKDALTPLIEIFTIPWDWNNDVPAKSIEDHLDSGAAGLTRGWGAGRDCFVDTLWLDPSEPAGGVHHLEYLFNALRSGNVEAVPVGGPGRGAAHTAAVAAIVAVDSRGACLRLDPDDFSDLPALPAAVDAWLNSLGIAAGDCDLIVDFRDVTAANYGAFNLLGTMLLPALPRLNEWRSLSLASGAFPPNLAHVDANSEERLDRHDWRLWHSLDQALSTRRPAFSDYVINHPGLTDPDPRTMRASASIRYAAPNHWLIVKRRWLRHGFVQYRDASAIVMAQPEYAGAGHCSGDDFISTCAAGGQTGNLTTWRTVGTSHHLQTTVEMLANLP